MPVNIGEIERLRGEFDGVTGRSGDESVGHAGTDIKEVAGFHLDGGTFPSCDILKTQDDFARDEIKVLVAELVVMVASQHARAQFNISKVTDFDGAFGHDCEFTLRGKKPGLNLGAGGRLIGRRQGFYFDEPAQKFLRR